MTHLKLGTKFVFLMVGILAVTLGLNSYYSIQEQKQQLLDELILDSNTIGSLFSRISIEALLAHDYFRLNAYAEEVIQNKNIDYCLFLDPNGNPLTSTVNNKELAVTGAKQNIIELVPLNKSEAERIQLTLLRFPIVNQHQILGSLVLGVNLDQVETYYNDILFRQFLIHALILLILASTIFWVFRHHVIRPIKKIIDAAGRVATGNYNQKIELKANDEIGALTTAFNMMMSDVKRDRENLAHQAHFDLLTGLPNRTSALNYIQDAIKDYENHRNPFALLFIDINDFKLINDSMGHHMGDQILITLAKRLEKNVRQPSMLARLGGDVFLLIIRNFKDQEQLKFLAQRILDSIAGKFHLEQREMYLKASIGIAIYPHNGLTTEMLMSNADNAMYQAKFNQFGGYCFFSQQMHDQINHRMELEHDLHNAIKNNELEIKFQPLIDHQSKQCIAAEVLLRWKHPEKGYIPPDVFIPIAESTGLIIKIGEWVIHNALRTYNDWRAKGVELDFIAINVSRIQFQSDFLTTMEKAIEKYQVAPQHIELEMTESVLMDEGSNITETLNKLSEMGFKLSLDDFGTGYSSLSYLRRFPFNTLKIDKSFITEIPDNSNDAELVRTIMAMAHSLNLKVVGEGVEQQSQSLFLSDLGCNLLQGYLYAKPLAARDFTEFLNNQKIPNN